jgi:hypothetical protein
MAIIKPKPKPKQFKLKTIDMEVSVANFLNWRTNIIVPNISWSFFNHECDLLRLSKAGFASEIEIKISKSDLIKDKEKRRQHYHDKIKYLYFAIPDYLQDHIEHIPKRAGIIIVSSIKKIRIGQNESYKCKQIRDPICYCQYKFTESERLRLLELMAMRIWRLKLKLAKR